MIYIYALLGIGIIAAAVSIFTLLTASWYDATTDDRWRGEE